MNTVATATLYWYAPHMLQLNPKLSSMPYNVMQNVNPLLLRHSENNKNFISLWFFF